MEEKMNDFAAANKNEMILEIFLNLINQFIEANSKFKIGKTGQDLDARFDSVYRDQYDSIRSLMSSPDNIFIDHLEEWLITSLLEIEEYSSRCDNEQRGGGDMETSDIYHLYIVIKN